MIKSIRGTEIRFMRKNSLGLEGTYQNAEHHAQDLIGMIDYLKDRIERVGFKEWVQGHNVHEFKTYDERRFTLRGFKKDGEYVGIRLSARLSRSEEFRIMDVTTTKECVKMLALMEKMAEDPKGDLGSLIC